MSTGAATGRSASDARYAVATAAARARSVSSTPRTLSLAEGLRADEVGDFWLTSPKIATLIRAREISSTFE